MVVAARHPHFRAKEVRKMELISFRDQVDSVLSADVEAS